LPVIGETVAMFGPERCLFGSNFPIEKLWTDYGSIVDAFGSALGDLGEGERDAIFYGNAVRLYRL
jgi:predicted TIM-barrel fold metal-dependent hydrolase